MIYSTMSMPINMKREIERRFKKNNQRKKKNGIWLRILLVREKIEANESFLMEREGKREDCESSGVEGFR